MVQERSLSNYRWHPIKKGHNYPQDGGVDFHFSYSDWKSVWSHCMVSTHVVSEGYSYAFDYRSYFRDYYFKENGLMFKSKNDLAIELIDQYESLSNESLCLVGQLEFQQKIDWYMQHKRVPPLGGLRTNRKVYQQGLEFNFPNLSLIISMLMSFAPSRWDITDIKHILWRQSQWYGKCHNPCILGGQLWLNKGNRFVSGVQ